MARHGTRRRGYGTSRSKGGGGGGGGGKKTTTYPTLKELRERGAQSVPGGGGMHYILCEGGATHWKVGKDDDEVFDSTSCWCEKPDAPPAA